MTDEKLNPDAYEQLYLLNIENQRKMSISDIENFRVSMKQKVVTPQDLLSIINLFRTYEAYFLSYEPIVRRLDRIGKTRLSKRLDEILIDIRETLEIFKKPYQDMLDSKNKVHRSTCSIGEDDAELNK